MYLELFEYFANNRDILPNTALPLSPDLLSAVYNSSNPNIKKVDKFLSSKETTHSKNKLGGTTMDSIDACLKLVRLFVYNKEPIYNVLNLSDYQRFSYSLKELESILIEMLTAMSKVIAKKANDELAANEQRILEQNKMGINIDDHYKNKNECESKTDDELKEDADEDYSHEEKDKHDDSDSLDNKNDMECMSWVFNEDITCSHG